MTIPGTVTTIGDGAFAGCENLRSIYVFAPDPISLTAAEARSMVTRAEENVPFISFFGEALFHLLCLSAKLIIRHVLGLPLVFGL